MRGNPQAISGRLPRAGPSRRWTSWIGELIVDWRGRDGRRQEVVERLGREGRRARALGQYVPEREQRVRPW
ncbi:MAG TPA: hypothetical protein VE983_07120 [Solirubrobacteraceae bacterium]|nr:hypothetical protein [Solirubrobacteraceae bacterium]